jgi:hypothetical protein
MQPNTAGWRCKSATRGADCGRSPVPLFRGSGAIVQDGASGPGETSTEDKDCSDFRTYSEALRFFRANRPRDPHGLDGDGDGQPYESLPGGPRVLVSNL